MKLPIFQKSSDDDLSVAILDEPVVHGSWVEKGVIITNRCDDVCALVPDIQKRFYLVERYGWDGLSYQRSADIKLIEDLSTLEQAKSLFPETICLPFANADFVDTDVFRPLPVEKTYLGIQIAAWEPFKRHDLFIRGVALLPEKRFLKFGHFWRKNSRSRALRQRTIRLAKHLAAPIDFPFQRARINRELPQTAEAVNVLINTASLGILTSGTEGTSRFKMECLAADIPFLVPEDACQPVKKHINSRTGVFFRPTPQGLADAILYVEENYETFSPRAYILEHTGKKIALDQLRRALRTLAVRDGSTKTFDQIDWDGRNQSLLWGAEALQALRAL